LSAVCGAALVSSRIFGGEDADTFTLHAEVEVYDPVVNSWRQLPSTAATLHQRIVWQAIVTRNIRRFGFSKRTLVAKLASYDSFRRFKAY